MGAVADLLKAGYAVVTVKAHLFVFFQGSFFSNELHLRGHQRS